MRLVLAVLFAALPALAEDSVPLIIPHQGRLLDGDGKGVTADVQMKFGLYKNAGADGNGNDPSWWEGTAASVKVFEGMYAIALGHATSGTGAIPAAAFQGAGDRWLSVVVDGKPMSPRIRVGSSPFAIEARHATSADALTSACAGCVETSHIKDAGVTNAKLAVTADKIANLNADTLDGLDSAAFAPSSIQSDITAIATKLATVDGKADTIVTNTGGLATSVSGVKGDTEALLASTTGIKTDTTAIKTDTAATKLDTTAIKTDAAATKLDTTAIKTDAAATKLDTTAIKTDVAALKTDVAALKGLNGAYSKTCSDFAAKGWANLAACQQDGRWHQYFTIVSGKTDTAPDGMNAFHAASVQGADTKMRLGREWYAISVRAVDAPTDFWVFLTEIGDKMGSFVVRSNGTITNFYVNNYSGATQSAYNDAFRSDLGNRHYLQHYYSDVGAFTTTANGGAEFWARY